MVVLVVDRKKIALLGIATVGGYLLWLRVREWMKKQPPPPERPLPKPGTPEIIIGPGPSQPITPPPQLPQPVTPPEEGQPAPIQPSPQPPEQTPPPSGGRPPETKPQPAQPSAPTLPLEKLKIDDMIVEGPTSVERCKRVAYRIRIRLNGAPKERAYVWPRLVVAHSVLGAWYVHAPNEVVFEPGEVEKVVEIPVWFSIDGTYRLIPAGECCSRFIRRYYKFKERQVRVNVLKPSGCVGQVIDLEWFFKIWKGNGEAIARVVSKVDYRRYSYVPPGPANPYKYYLHREEIVTRVNSVVRVKGIFRVYYGLKKGYYVKDVGIFTVTDPDGRVTTFEKPIELCPGYVCGATDEISIPVTKAGVYTVRFRVWDREQNEVIIYVYDGDASVHMWLNRAYLLRGNEVVSRKVVVDKDPVPFAVWWRYRKIDRLYIGSGDKYRVVDLVSRYMVAPGTWLLLSDKLSARLLMNNRVNSEYEAWVSTATPSNRKTFRVIDKRS